MLPKIEDIRVRSKRDELMDSLHEDRALLEEILVNIAKVNKLLGGNQITINAISKAAKKRDSSKPIRIIDIGCGGGDMCRQIAKSSNKFSQPLEIIGVDINELSLEIATDLSRDYENVRYENVDVFSDEFRALKPDFIISTLTLHHFSSEDIVRMLKLCLKVEGVEVFINDLHRSALAFRLFKPVSYILGLHEINRSDGLISILRAFTKEDLMQYSNLIKQEIPKVTSKIQWKWAFRYLWTLKIYES